MPDDTAAASIPGAGALGSPAGRQPTASASVAHRPLGGSGARLTGGLLADWQERNRAASLPLAMRQLNAAGNLANLQLAISGPAAGAGPAVAKPGADGAWVGGARLPRPGLHGLRRVQDARGDQLGDGPGARGGHGRVRG